MKSGEVSESETLIRQAEAFLAMLYQIEGKSESDRLQLSFAGRLIEPDTLEALAHEIGLKRWYVTPRAL